MDSYPVADKKSQTLMQLAHYFITVENYTPIVVKGAENELWLENLDAPYRIIRLNLNYIHNNEQLKFDLFKIMTNYSLPRIGSIFGNKHYSTVKHACDKIDAEITTDSSLNEEIKELINRINAY